MFKKLDLKSIKHNEEEKISYRILILLMIYGTAYYFVFKPLTIGHDMKYNFYIVWLPIIIGLIVIYRFRKDFFKRLNKTFKSKIDKALTYLFLLFMGLMYSYLSFGITTEIAFHVINKQRIKNEQRITCIFPIKKVFSSSSTKSFIRNNYITFDFHNHSEKIKIDNSLYSQLKNETLKNIKVKIVHRKGMFDVYYIDNWTVINMNDK